MTNAITTTISDEQLQALQKQVGVVRRPDYEDWQLNDSLVTRSSIRTWTVHTADMRPLYIDPDVAAASPWGKLIAPPAMIMASEQFDPETDCLPGAFSILASAKLAFDNPISIGDTVLSESEIKSVKELSKGASGRTVSVTIETRVVDSSGKTFGTTLLDWHLYERGSAAQRALFGDRKDGHMYSQQDIEALGAEYKQEVQRGTDPLLYDDVKEGDEIQTLLKGPTTRARHIQRHEHVWFWGHKQGWDEMSAHPERFFVNENGALEPVIATDWVHHRAQRWGGLPGALEVASDRPHYLAHALANWMGDAGYPLNMDLAFPTQNLIGDLTRTRGRVTGKRREDGRGIVSLDVTQTNQLDQTITTGSAEVILPTR